MSSDGMDGRKIVLNNVYLGDCKNYIAKFPDDCVDLIVLDPPLELYTYGQVKISGCKIRVGEEWEDIRKDQSFEGTVMPVWLEDCYRVLKHNRMMAVFFPSSQLYRYSEYEGPMRKAIVNAGFRFVDRIFNCEYVFEEGITKELMLKNHGFVLLFSKGDPFYVGEGRFLACFGERPGLNERSMKIWGGLLPGNTMPGMVVLDLFAGSAGLGEAAMRLGRNYIGIEIDPKTFAKAFKRIFKVKKEIKSGKK